MIQPDDEIVAIGSGRRRTRWRRRGRCRAHTELPAAEIVRRGLEIAGEICIYTNQNITVLELD